ncbi:MAG TPA: CoA transferase [Burkholderiaceae bacterium]|nr:CoA transferase [Burkholderiaceae bacterium]
MKPLKGVRILSLSLNLPGPAALMRCKSMGATCVKLEPPSGDPMQSHSAHAYQHMHTGIRTLKADLKSATGQRALQRELAKTDVLLTSFRPSALDKLGLSWKALHKAYPKLSMVAIVGAPGALAEIPGHDLTYMAENDLVTGLELPASLYADMGGSLMASEAVLQAVLTQRNQDKGVYQTVSLSQAAAYLGLPRVWGLTLPKSIIGGAHAGYRVYPCKNGRVAVAALEPHFAASLCAVVGIKMTSSKTMFTPATHQAIATWLATQTRQQLNALAKQHDLPLHTLL